jgi:ADP-ribosylglycohydrolase
MSKLNAPDRASRYAGVILGTAVGDALGLPREGLSARRARKMFGAAPLRFSFIGGWGMTSDDTEHTCMTAQALLASHGEPAAFARSLSWRLRGWFLTLPAGVGMATARAIIKLWIGFGPQGSGVFSAGNGPAMRAAIIGVYSREGRSRLVELVRASTRMTHTDPAAEHGALAIALAAAMGAESCRKEINASQYLDLVRPYLESTPMMKLLESAAEAVGSQHSLAEYLDSMGLKHGVSGYINHTVPAAIFCWLKWAPDFRESVEQIILAGGDTDSTGAIVGGLIGATGGVESIPADWIGRVLEWPRSASWMRKLASAMDEDQGALALFWPGLLLRNALFVGVVLVHGFRRLLPPY